MVEAVAGASPAPRIVTLPPVVVTLAYWNDTPSSTVRELVVALARPWAFFMPPAPVSVTFQVLSPDPDVKVPPPTETVPPLVAIVASWPAVVDKPPTSTRPPQSVALAAPGWFASACSVRSCLPVPVVTMLAPMVVAAAVSSVVLRMMMSRLARRSVEVATEFVAREIVVVTAMSGVIVVAGAAVLPPVDPASAATSASNAMEPPAVMPVMAVSNTADGKVKPPVMVLTVKPLASRYCRLPKVAEPVVPGMLATKTSTSFVKNLAVSMPPALASVLAK